MELLPEKRFGIFLIGVSVWYLINLRILNALHPILAIPGSVIFLIGLWLILMPTTSAIPTMLTTRTNAPTQAPLNPTVRSLTGPVAKPAAKPTANTAKKVQKPAEMTETTKPKTRKVKRSIKKRKPSKK